MKATSENSSVEADCADLGEVGTSNTIRETLNRQLEDGDLWEQEVELNQARVAHIPGDMPRGGLEIAIDFHDEPFYGKSAELRCATKPKRG